MHVVTNLISAISVPNSYFIDTPRKTLSVAGASTDVKSVAVVSGKSREGSVLKPDCLLAI
jgi:hypothetical protein